MQNKAVTFISAASDYNLYWRKGTSKDEVNMSWRVRVKVLVKMK